MPPNLTMSKDSLEIIFFCESLIFQIYLFLQIVNIEASDGLLDHASTIFIIVGAFVFVVGFLGCCGALKKHPGMLFLVNDKLYTQIEQVV